MRALTRLNSLSEARSLGDFLYSNGIDIRLDHDKEDESWVLWVIQEDDLSEADALLEHFTSNREDPAIQQAGAQAERLRFEEELRQKELGRRHREIDARTELIRNATMPRAGFVSLTLIGICIVVFLSTSLPNWTPREGEEGFSPLYQLFSITEYRLDDHVATLGKKYISWNPTLPEVRAGQIWRLITPMFLHFGFIHILFNMMWLYQLGGLLEQLRGPFFLIILISFLSAGSNSAQFMMSGPTFGGMSGVVYGLLGYLWTKGRFDPRFEVQLNPQVMRWMIAWLVLCMTGLLGNIANTAHVSGLLLGAAWGYFSSPHWRSKLRSR